MNQWKIIKRFLSNIECGSCGGHCDPADISVLGHQEDTWLFSVYCPSCDSRGLVTVDIKVNEETEVVAELTEAEESESSIPVDFADVLEMYIFLKDFDGDFASLFTPSTLNL